MGEVHGRYSSRCCCVRTKAVIAKAATRAVLNFGCYFMFSSKVLNFCIILLEQDLNIIFSKKTNLQLYQKIIAIINNPSIINILKTMQNQQQQEQTEPKIKFSEQPDASSKKISTILSTIQKQQQQILSLLSKYKKTIPEDEYQAEQKQRNQLNRSAFVKDNQRSVIGNGKYYGKSAIKSERRTIPVNNSVSVAKDKYSQYIVNRDVKILDKSKFQTYLGEARKNIKLPSVYNKANSKKQQIEIDYEKADKKYNENVIKFYEELGAKKERTINDPINQINKSKQKKNNKKSKRIESSLILSPPAQSRATQATKINVKKFQNIFDPDQLNQAESLIGMEHQIAKPIAYRPYSDILQYQQQKNDQKQSRTNSKAQKIQNDDDEDKPVQVSMTYYIRTFNEKWKQQCQQQINYLYFSKGDEDDSNKQWAEEVVKMFERHDNDLMKFHSNMRYLETFDEGFFTAGIYQGTQANKKGY